MTDDGLRRSEHYAVFHAGRAKRVRLQAMEEIDGRRRGRDLSAAKWQLRLRAYVEAVATDQAFVLDLELDKVVGKAAAGDTGIGEVSVTFAAADAGDLFLEAVAVDTDTDAVGTPSGKAEYELDRPWAIAVLLAPGAPPA